MKYDNTNRGSLFKNKNKKQGDKRPDMTGRININGVDYWLSSWTKTSEKTSDKFLSLQVRPMDEEQVKGEPEHIDLDMVDDEIPF